MRINEWICTWKSRQDTTESLRSDSVSDLPSIHLCVKESMLTVQIASASLVPRPLLDFYERGLGTRLSKYLELIFCSPVN